MAMNFSSPEATIDWFQVSSCLAFIHKVSQDTGLTKAAQHQYLVYHQRVCADMLINTAPYSMARWKPQRLKKSAFVATWQARISPLPTSRRLPTMWALQDSSTSYHGDVVVVALVEEAEDVAAAEVHGTLVLHTTQRTYSISAAQSWPQLAALSGTTA